jgi:hypothetical protein
MRGQTIFKRKLNMETAEFETVATYFIDGTEVSKAEFEVEFPPQPIISALGDGSRAPEFVPIHSEALGYHPRQIPEAREHFKKLGIGDTHIDAMGRPLLRDRQHRRRVLKALGKVDFSSFTGY